MQDTYFTILAKEDVEEVTGIEPLTTGDEKYFVSGHLTGALSMRPGTGVGNQPTEAFQRPWQAAIEESGGAKDPTALFSTMQCHYSVADQLGLGREHRVVLATL